MVLHQPGPLHQVYAAHYLSVLCARDFIAKGVQAQNQRFATIERKLSKLEDQTIEIARVQEELKNLMNEVNKKAFSLKDEGFEVIRTTFLY